MSDLPISIETYLAESGYSNTELLLLRHSLAGHPMTLRELASRTGKSTGVLSQAARKLVHKKILTKQLFNNSPKYVLNSLDAIRQWIAKDIDQKKDELKRKHQDFTHFIDCIQLDEHRPKMEYFEGEDGLQKALDRLLDMQRGDMLQWLPVNSREENDPHCEIRAEHIRLRKVRNIPLRVLIHDTALGRRYQSRDVFSARQSKLVSQHACPIVFEKYVSGDTIVCVNMSPLRVCFIHYPELANVERLLFESIWKYHQKDSGIPHLPSAKTLGVHHRIIASVKERFGRAKRA